MIEIIIGVVVAAGAFALGVIYGRKNKKSVQKVFDTLDKVEDKVKIIVKEVKK